jgi:hypothetical protein
VEFIGVIILSTDRIMSKRLVKRVAVLWLGLETIWTGTLKFKYF